jgi:hypothetical protein
MASLHHPPRDALVSTQPVQQSPVRRALPAIFLVVFLLAGAAYFFITARMVGRHILADLPQPRAFAGPDLINGYSLSRGLTGPESFIEGPRATPVMPPADEIARVGVVRVGLTDRFIVGELAQLRSGRSRGFFLIDTLRGEVHGPLPPDEWQRLIGERLPGVTPELYPADSYPGPEGTP